MVNKFPKVFLDDLFVIPLDKEIDFWIVLLLDTRHISIHQYSVALTEFKELKEQLKDFQDKGFIYSSVSP